MASVVFAAFALAACDVEPSDEELRALASEDVELARLDAAQDLTRPSDDEPAATEPGLVAEPDVQGYVWKAWVSEEDPASTCGTGQILTGMDCEGSFCDAVRPECHSFGGVLGESNWSPWFSEEGARNYQCPGTQYITGVTCAGSYCDSLSVECTATSLAKYNCSWAGPFSEEQQPYLAPTGRAISGIWCAGAYCDNKWYLTCSV